MFQNCAYSTMHCGILRTCFFSKLRFGKSRLRSLIGQESLLLCSIEFDLLTFHNDIVYRKLPFKVQETTCVFLIVT